MLLGNNHLHTVAVAIAKQWQTGGVVHMENKRVLSFVFWQMSANAHSHRMVGVGGGVAANAASTLSTDISGLPLLNLHREKKTERPS